MKKRTAIILLVCATVIIICAIAGISRRNAQQAEQLQQAAQAQQAEQPTKDQLQQDMDDYCARLAVTFDSLLDMQTNAAGQMEERRAAGASDREILSDFITSIGDSIQQLADVEAPETLSGAHQHFANAADSYADAAEDLTDLLDSGDLSSLNAKLKLAKLAPTALDALDEVKAGIQELEDSGADVPESAKQLAESLDTLVDAGIKQAMSGGN
ncbi:MAG: hypothetical protein Q4P20_02620 [Eubacteriales bacterium]|nr:hypothetical protein [Eubacteriales bacterium]